MGWRAQPKRAAVMPRPWKANSTAADVVKPAGDAQPGGGASPRARLCDSASLTGLPMLPQPRRPFSMPMRMKSPAVTPKAPNNLLRAANRAACQQLRQRRRRRATRQALQSTPHRDQAARDIHPPVEVPKTRPGTPVLTVQATVRSSSLGRCSSGSTGTHSTPVRQLRRVLLSTLTLLDSLLPAGSTLSALGHSAAVAAVVGVNTSLGAVGGGVAGATVSVLRFRHIRVEETSLSILGGLVRPPPTPTTMCGCERGAQQSGDRSRKRWHCNFSREAPLHLPGLHHRRVPRSSRLGCPPRWLLRRPPRLLHAAHPRVRAAPHPSPVSATPQRSLPFVKGVSTAADTVLSRRLRIDDPVGAFAVHCLPGALGCIAVGLLGVVSDCNGAENAYGAGQLTMDAHSWRVLRISPRPRIGFAGLLTGAGAHQLGVQLMGICAILAWTTTLTAIVMLMLKHTLGIRVSPEEEAAGLDYSEHLVAKPRVDVIEIVAKRYALPRLSLQVEFALTDSL